MRDPQRFLPLPIVQPERAALYGETGLLRALEGAFAAAKPTIMRAELRAAIQGGGAALKPLLTTLAEKVRPTARDGEPQPKSPSIIQTWSRRAYKFRSRCLIPGGLPSKFLCAPGQAFQAGLTVSFASELEHGTGHDNVEGAITCITCLSIRLGRRSPA